MRTLVLLGVVVGLAGVGLGFACGGDDDVCVANCMGRECGLEPNCGRESCGTCPADRPICNYGTGQCSAEPSTCGNGTCSASENCATCPADCGCPSGQTCDASGRCVTPGACTTNADCDAESICISNHCTLIWGREYTFTLTTGHLDTDGCFDPGCGAPDTIVVVWVDGAWYWESTEASDSFAPSWYESFNLTIYEATTMKVFLWDEDVWPDDNDPINETVDFTLAASWIKAGTIGPVPSDAPSYVSFTIMPR